jgi:predicted DNA-binding transcriptional regulator AlpA
MGSQTEYEFLFVVDGVSVDDDRAVTTITGTFDGLLSWNRGVHRLAVSSEGVDAMDAFERLFRRITPAVPGLRILWLDPDLVGIPDIAERTGHSRQNVQQWVSRERNADRPFPPPEGSAGRSLVWQWADVNEWLKPLSLDDQSARPTREESVLINAALVNRNNASQTPLQVPAEQPAPLASTPSPASEPRSSSLYSARQSTVLAERHRDLIARLPVVTGRDLAEWFHRIESGPSFLRSQERADWLADDGGISRGYAYAIVREYEMRRRLRLGIEERNAEESRAVPSKDRPQ